MREATVDYKCHIKILKERKSLELNCGRKKSKVNNQ